MDRDEWLKQLKIGDKVANQRYGSYSIYTIKKITKTGQIRLTNDILLSSDGKYYKYVRFGNSLEYNIEPLTDEIIKHLEYRKIQSTLSREVEIMMNNKIKECSSWSIKTLENVKKFLENL